MRRVLATVVGVVIVSTIAFGSARAATDPGILRGTVLDATCYGPCMIGQDYPPYTGENGRVVVRRVRDNQVVFRRELRDGRFGVHLRPGAYLVKAWVDQPCWRGETKRVRVVRDEITRVVLHVGNVCIV